ncbi:hypothetical protein SS50377_20793 [Spironucleus salmonicida]|uniref:Uncharacterized protein n=1 Tax=Spironucleus salmonicida TaxID=348837 RepID=V6M1M3_9EUKA|nr:hypothetical protein SS50377_20793 [Spironucleus salmonicida]|eukprot:EST47099.1 Hypothetical protein SS50377_12805 [Spironucleus salmonicida]
MGCSPAQQLVHPTSTSGLETYQYSENVITLPTKLLASTPFASLSTLAQCQHPVIEALATFAIAQFESGRSSFFVRFEPTIAPPQQEKFVQIARKSLEIALRGTSTGRVPGIHLQGLELVFARWPCQFARDASDFEALLAAEKRDVFAIYFDPHALPRAAVEAFLERLRGGRFLRKTTDFCVVFVRFQADLVAQIAGSGRSVLSEALVSAEMRSAEEQVLRALAAGIHSVRLQKPLDGAFLGVLSQLLSIQHLEMRDFRLSGSGERSENGDNMLIELSWHPADEKYKSSYLELYQYILKLLPAREQTRIRQLYNLDIERPVEVDFAFVQQVTAEAVQQYLFSNQNIIDVGTSQFNAEKIELFKTTIQQEIEKQLLGTDKCEISETAEGEIQLVIYRTDKSGESKFSGLL